MRMVDKYYYHLILDKKLANKSIKKAKEEDLDFAKLIRRLLKEYINK